MLIELQKLKKNSQQNNSETVTNEYDKETLKKDMYLLKRDKKLLMIENYLLRLKEYDNEISKNQKILSKIIQKHFQMRMIQKYLKKERK